VNDDAVPVLSAVSRKTHGSAGIFDLDLPLSGSFAVESRNSAANGTHSLVIRFANTLGSVGGATVTSGAASVSSSQIGSDAHEYIVNLTNVGNAQRLIFRLDNVTDSFGYYSTTVPITIGFLQGTRTAMGL